MGPPVDPLMLVALSLRFLLLTTLTSPFQFADVNIMGVMVARRFLTRLRLRGLSMRCILYTSRLTMADEPFLARPLCLCPQTMTAPLLSHLLRRASTTPPTPAPCTINLLRTLSMPAFHSTASSMAHMTPPFCPSTTLQLGLCLA